MAFFKRARLWVNNESVSAITKLYFAETVRCSTVVDKNVVRLDICGLIRHDIIPDLYYLYGHNYGYEAHPKLAKHFVRHT